MVTTLLVTPLALSEPALGIAFFAVVFVWATVYGLLTDETFSGWRRALLRWVTLGRTARRDT